MALTERHLIPAVIGLLCLFLPHLHAQETPAAPAPLPQFRVVAMTDLATLFYDADKTKEIVNAGVGSFSRIYTAPKNRLVVLYTEVPNADPALPPKKVILAKAQLPAQKPGPFLIMLNKNPAGAEMEFSTMVLDHSLEAHPAQTYLVFNFSKRRLAVNLADTNLVLSTGQSEKVAYPDTRKAWLKIAADEQTDGWLLVSSSPHAVGANTRTTVFIVDIPPSERDPNPKGIVARRIRETIYTDDAGVHHVR